MKQNANKILKIIASGVLLFYLTAQNSVFAQIEDEEFALQTWVDYNYLWALNPKIDLIGFGGVRSIFPGLPWLRFIARPGIRYFKNDIFDFYGGLDLRHTFRDSVPDITEFRPIQGVRAHWPKFKNFQIRHFLRLEERFQFPGDGLDFTLRLRFRISTTLRLKKGGFVEYFYMPLSAEIFANLSEKGDQFNDVIRLTTGLGYVFNGSWTLQLDLIGSRTNDGISENIDTRDFIIRIRIYQRFGGKIFTED